MDVIVTGGSGFIGHHLTGRLKSRGVGVISLNRTNGDITKKDTWDSLPKVHSVIHLAGRSYVPDSWINSGDFVETNVVGTQRALDYCRKSGASMVYANAYPYGIPDKLPINENMLPSNQIAHILYLNAWGNSFVNLQVIIIILQLRHLECLMSMVKGKDKIF